MIIVLVLVLVLVAVLFWALADAIIRPRSAFDSAHKSKTLWLVLLVVAIPLVGLPSGLIGIVYLVHVRPEVKAATPISPMSKSRWAVVAIWLVLIVASAAFVVGSAQKIYSVGVTASNTGGNGGADPDLWWWFLYSLVAFLLTLTGLVVTLATRRRDPPDGQIATPGWYPDYADPRQQRYFDGVNWTGHIAPHWW